MGVQRTTIIYLDVLDIDSIKVWVVGKECSPNGNEYTQEMRWLSFVKAKRSFNRWCLQRSYAFLLCMEKLY
jgi:hypothetical protein